MTSFNACAVVVREIEALEVVCSVTVCRKMSATKEEQRVVIKFLTKLGDKPSVILSKLKEVYGDECLSAARVYEWAKRFKEGRQSVEDDVRPGAPVTVHTEPNVERLRVLVRSDRRLTIRMLATELDINKETVRQMLHNDLKMRKLCAKLVPKTLTDEQKELRLSICEECVERIQTEGRDWMRTVITGDESWVFQYDPETRRQSKQWVEEGGERPEKARMSRSQMKSMLLCFFDIQGIVHREWLPQGQTVTAAFYEGVLQRLCARVARVRPELAKTGWILHHDNAPAHSAFRIQQFLARRQIPTLPHPPYSPDLAPLDFWLFPNLKSPMKGKRYESIDVIQEQTTAVLKTFKVPDFQRCFQKWEERWNKCVALRGGYCEGMNA